MKSSIIRSAFRLPGVRQLSSQAPLIDVKVNDKTGVATVTMQRSPVNSINLELAQELKKSISDLEANRSRGMILTSAQPTVFSAGLDILEMHNPNPERVKNFWIALQELWMSLYVTSFPTVAAINGHSPAGGCLLACSCEYRVMVNTGGKPYTIGLNETLLGIIPPFWFVDSYQNTLSKRIAEKALIAGKLFPVDEALAVGLIDEVAADKDDAVSKAEKWIAGFSRVNPLARSLTKRQLRGPSVEKLKKNQENDLNTFLGFVTSEKVQQSLTLYLEALKKKA